jgi:hypothetical protein
LINHLGEIKDLLIDFFHFWFGLVRKKQLSYLKCTTLF